MDCAFLFKRVMILYKEVILIHKQTFLLTILISLLLLIGCSSNTQIKTPNDFRYEAGFLYWEEVSNAEHYVIDINNTSKLVYNNRFELKDFPTGNYTAKIAAFGKGMLSPYSTEVSFQLIKSDNIEQITFSKTSITWLNLSGLVYEVNVYHADNQQLIETSTSELNQFDYSALSDGIYDIEIKAFLDTTLVTSKTIRFLKRDFTYVREVGVVLDIDVPTGIQFNQTALLIDTDYIVDEYGLILDSSAIDTLEETVEGFTVILDYEIDVYVYMDLIKIEKPIMVSSNYAVYKGADLSFTFDLKGGLFEGLSGTDITEDDYTFEDGILTIKSSFIERMIEKDPDTTTLILPFLLTNKPHLVFGFISIKIT